MKEEKINPLITAGKMLTEEQSWENSLRPKTLSEFVGQDGLKANLRVFIQAARQRQEPMDHCLFYSPPGLGKTTLAHIIAQELGVNLRMTSGPVLERVGDLAAILTNLKEGDVFFIDEIHRLNHLVEEALYPAMEDFNLDIVIGQGPSARTIKLPLPRFTLIGATTRAGLISGPLRERFGIVHHLDFYGLEDIKKIIQRSSGILKTGIEEAAITEIARRSRGTPRIANRILRRLRDFADVRSNGKITRQLAEESLDLLGIDKQGLDALDRKILLTIAEKFQGGPVGIETLAVAVADEVDTITEVCEPYLIQIGFLQRTPRGRQITPLALKHLGIELPANQNAPKLF